MAPTTMSVEAFEQWLRSLGFDTAAGGLTLQVFFVVFATLIVNVAVGMVHKRLLARAEKTELIWDNALLDAVGGQPLRLLIWLIGITFAADIVARHSDAPIFDAIDPVRTIGVIALFAWALTRLIENFAHGLVIHRKRRGKQIDEASVAAVNKLLRIAVVITAVLIGLQSLGFSVSGVLAFGGIGGIAVGFAAKDLLANFFGAIMIYFDRPFVIGDWIRSPDRDIEGTVEDIGWRLTRIRTFDKRPLYVPNAIFTQIAVENPSRMTHRRIHETIGIRYVDLAKMKRITDAVREMLIGHDDIDERQTMIVHFNSFNQSSVDFFIYTFTRTTAWIKYHEIKQDILLRVAEIIESHDAQIAFPTQTLHLPDGLRIETAGDLLDAAKPARAGAPAAAQT